jgi:hypothetical protein
LIVVGVLSRGGGGEPRPVRCDPGTETISMRLAPASRASEAAAAANGLKVGIDGGYGPWSNCEADQRQVLGAVVTRHQWIEEEPVDAQDQLVLEATEKVHTRLEALVGDNEITDPQGYARFVVALIERYGKGGSFWSEHPGLDERTYAIHTFELGNEPYFGGQSAAEYADAVRPALEAIKRAGLPGRIVLPSRVYGEETEWVEAYYQQIPGLNSLFDAFAEHPYDYGQGPASPGPAGPFLRIATLREKMNALGAGAKPILITEYGESTADCGEECVGEELQARHIREMIEAVVEHRQWKVSLLMIYQLIDRGEESGEQQLEFGLLREDGQPKPAFPIVYEAASRYRG